MGEGDRGEKGEREREKRKRKRKRKRERESCGVGHRMGSI